MLLASRWTWVQLSMALIRRPILFWEKQGGSTDGQRSCKEGKDDEREYKGGVVIVLAAYTTRHQKHSVEGDGTELGAKLQTLRTVLEQRQDSVLRLVVQANGQVL